jgi:predicted SprT family Zn-dependent metalloprotease
MLLDVHDDETIHLLLIYIERLGLPMERLKVTTCRATYGRWLGRPVPSAYGGAYAFLPRTKEHAILIHLERIDRTAPRAVEVVVAEELVHMRDRLDGDLRRHAHHGHDRIARRVAELTGVSPGEIRAALLPVRRRELRYTYQCPTCGIQVRRRVRGTWSCSRCSPRFDRRHVLQLVADARSGDPVRNVNRE